MTRVAGWGVEERRTEKCNWWTVEGMQNRYKMILGDTSAWESLLEMGQQDKLEGTEEFLLGDTKGNGSQC